MKTLLLVLITLSAYSHNIRQYPGAPLEVITVGHPTLYLQAEEVSEEEIKTQDFQNFIDDMIRTMKKAGGVGLAAPQVNVSKRLFVMKPSLFKKAEAIINPVIEYLSDYGQKDSREGCLSIPGKTYKVRRYKRLNLSYVNRKGEHKKEQAKGFRAIVIQHEYDHLNGTLISDIFLRSLDLDDDFEFHYPQM